MANGSGTPTFGFTWSRLIWGIATIASIAASWADQKARQEEMLTRVIRLEQVVSDRVYTKSEIDLIMREEDRTHTDMARRLDRLERLRRSEP